MTINPSQMDEILFLPGTEQAGVENESLRSNAMIEALREEGDVADRDLEIEEEEMVQLLEEEGKFR